MDLNKQSIKERLEQKPWSALRNTHHSPQLHEVIKCELYNEALTRGFLPRPEMDVDELDNNYHVDMGWVENGNGYNLVAAFEIDGGVKTRSITKLRSLGDDVQKVIISKSPNQTYVKEAKEECPDDIVHIDAEVWRR